MTNIHSLVATNLRFVIVALMLPSGTTNITDAQSRAPSNILIIKELTLPFDISKDHLCYSVAWNDKIFTMQNFNMAILELSNILFRKEMMYV